MLQDIKNLTITNIIIVITVIMYIVQINMDYGSAILGLNSLFLSEGWYYQVLSTMFTHGGIGHLAMNMFVLFQFGNMIESNFGAKKLLFLYFVGGVLTSLGSFYFMYYVGFNHNLVGASGAITVLLGYIAIIDKRQRNGIITWVLLISVAPLLIGLPIAWYAHFIGLFIGMILGVFLKRV
ncbi:MAG: rhomboid family intramembrane serine protease [Campylobacterales bacterium]|nr:rhomboid family intramembrane serine protease [Campylobacterales bacterium]NQY53996.1 rhomboid family intramembrane serine protease [Campylobacteraceae bacterium]